MINFITGTITESNESSLVIECGSIGYEIFASTKTLEKKGNIGETVTILTYLCVKEEGLTLFGFHSKEEKSMFLKLIGISGIGPKVALSILSGIGLADLISVIASSNSSRLHQIKCIGKKTAERIILELKDKISADFVPDQTPTGSNSSQIQEATEWLVAMGFSKVEAQSKVSKGFKEGMSTEEIIKSALKG